MELAVQESYGGKKGAGFFDSDGTVGDGNLGRQVDSADLFLILAAVKFNQGPCSAAPAVAVQAAAEPAAFALAVTGLLGLAICAPRPWWRADAGGAVTIVTMITTARRPIAA